MAAPNLYLHYPYLLISGSASLNGIEIPASNVTLQFGTVAQVSVEGTTSFYVDDSVLFDLEGAIQLIMSDASRYWLVDQRKVYFTEPPVV